MLGWRETRIMLGTVLCVPLQDGPQRGKIHLWTFTSSQVPLCTHLPFIKLDLFFHIPEQVCPTSCSNKCCFWLQSEVWAVPYAQGHTDHSVGKMGLLFWGWTELTLGFDLPRDMSESCWCRTPGEHEPRAVGQHHLLMSTQNWQGFCVANTGSAKQSIIRVF